MQWPLPSGFPAPILLLVIGAIGYFPGPRALFLRTFLPLVIGFFIGPGPPSLEAHLPAGPVELEAVVCSPPRQGQDHRKWHGGRRWTTIRVDQIHQNDRPIVGHLWVTLPGSARLGRGDRVQLLLRAGSGNRRKVHSPEQWHILEAGGWMSHADHWRQAAIDRLLAADGWWGCALLLGERGLLDARTRSTMQKTGLGHLLAVSGLHIGIVLGLFLFLAKRLRPPWSSLLRCSGALVVLGQAFLSGADPPAIRAAMTGAMLAIGLLGGRIPSPLHALSFSMLIWCAMGLAPPAPAATISLCAVAGIHLVGAGRTDSRSILAAGLGAFFGAHVALAWYSPELSPLSPLWTLVMLPPISIGIVLAMVQVLFLDLLPTPLFRSGWEGIGALLEAITQLADQMPWSPWIAPVIGVPALSLAMLALLLISAGRLRFAVAALLVALLCVAIQDSLPDHGTMRLLPSGRGQCLLLDSPEATLLYDAGSLDAPDGGAARIRRALWRVGRSRVDWIIISHPHLDHYSAVPELMATGSVGGLLVSRNLSLSAVGRALEKQAQQHGVTVKHLSTGDRIKIGRWQLRIVVSPDPRVPGPAISTNDRSMVIEVEGPHGSILLPGDAEAPLLSRASLSGPIDLLLLPHHGSHSVPLAQWIAHLAPRQVIVSRRGPLPLETRQALASVGITSVGIAGEPILSHSKFSDSASDPLPDPQPLSMISLQPAILCRRKKGFPRCPVAPRNRHPKIPGVSPS
ncbi:MAG: ComEC/Rec2 family competence protein [Planctomycetota bacterium]|nr:ComEC/Rec2 family competence protein [Planctomycetota bacterium]